jgi:hypothetical protein
MQRVKRAFERQNATAFQAPFKLRIGLINMLALAANIQAPGALFFACRFDASLANRFCG